MALKESELLAHIYARSAAMPGSVVVGPGDDAAVVDLGGRALLLTVDQLVEGRHYDPAATAIDPIARKAVARSVSDIAAMGGEPEVALATGALRDGFEGADELFDAMARWGRAFGCPLVGGDIAFVDGPSVLTVTVAGRPHDARGPALRSDARAGDGVYVTGALGGAVATGRHLSFTPRVAEARALCDALCDRLGAMIDISDGLGRDAGRVAHMSGVCIELEASTLPLCDSARDWRNAAGGGGGGEDYELLFTARGDVPGEAAGTPVTKIGRVVEASGEPGCVIVTSSGERVCGDEFGWDHGAAESGAGGSGAA